MVDCKWHFADIQTKMYPIPFNRKEIIVIKNLLMAIFNTAYHINNCNFYHRVGAIIGGAVGGLLLVALVITCCVCICVKNKGRPGRIVAPTAGGPMVISKWLT